MTGCLYECLQEAKLERYHTLFVRHGITKCEGLAALSMQDYSRFGITRMEDRVRLFKLVQIVKSVQAEGRFCKHEAAKLEVSRPVPQFTGQPTHGQPDPGVKTRGQAFVHYLKSKTSARTSTSGLVGDSWSVADHNPMPQFRPESVMAPTKKRKPRQDEQVQFRPNTGSPIFKCRKVLTFSDDEDDEEDEEEERAETPDTVSSITDSEIRQKVLSTIPSKPPQSQSQPQRSEPSVTTFNFQSLHRNEPIRVTVPPARSFFIDINTNNNTSNQSTDNPPPKQSSSTDNLFGISANRIREPTIHRGPPVSQRMNAIAIGESPLQDSTQKRITSQNECENANISGELLAKKSASQARRQASVEAAKCGSESESDTETDEFFALPRPSDSLEKHPRSTDSTDQPAASSSSHGQARAPSTEPLKAIVVGQQTQSIDFTSQAVNSKISELQYNPANYSPPKKEEPTSSSVPTHRTREHSEDDQRLLGSATAVALPVSMGPRPIETKFLPKSSQMREARQRARRPDRMSEDTEHAYFPTSKPTPSPVRETVVERVVHNNTDYNYGVPTSTAKSESPSRQRSANRSNSNQRIRVCVRKRPMTRREQKRQEVDVVSADGADTIVVDETKVAIDLARYIQQHVYMFDEVFDETKTNKEVYASTAKPLVRHIFNKGCATCFAFGQTGAGKTYTLIGTPAVPGLYRLAAADMFSLLHSGQYGSDLHLWVSYYEIYCGQLYDLLNKRKKLHVRENGRQRVCIAGLMETRVRNVEDVAQVVQYGNSVRSTGSTGVNPNSSRSHALLQLEIRDSRDQRLGRMSFIDLAGSERAADVTEFDRQTRIEGAEINQSLLALKECIRSLDQESKHTPYRQSKLTHILRDSFVGNSRTCMIANISPSLSACENTLNTLRYADRVKELRKSTPPTQQPCSVPNETPTGRPFNAALFHPSNIQFSSTPKQNDQEQSGPQKLALTLQQDPYETPIRGHQIRKTPEKRKATPPQKHKRSPSSPLKTSPFEFRIERSSGSVSIKTSSQQDSSTERRSRSLSNSSGNHGNSGSNKKASPHGESSQKPMTRHQSPKSVEKQRKNSSHKSPYTNNENNFSGQRSTERHQQHSSEEANYRGRKSGYGTSDDGTDNEYYSPLKIPTVLDKLSSIGSAETTGKKYTSPHMKHPEQGSSSHSRSSFIAEHRQILNHLDNIMDRAKSAIEESSSCENSPQKFSPPQSSSSQPNLRNSLSSHQNIQSTSKLHKSRLDEYNRYDEVIAQQSELYDLRSGNISKPVLLDKEPVKQHFRALKEDTDSVEDHTEHVDEISKEDTHMPDGHHFSPQRDDSDSNNGADDQQLDEISSDDTNEEEEEETSQNTSEEDDYCSCSSSHPKLAKSNGSSSLGLINAIHQRNTPNTVSTDRNNSHEHDRPESIQNRNLQPLSRAETRPQTLGTSHDSATDISLGPMHHSDHDISKHINTIRQLLSADTPDAPVDSVATSASYSDDRRIPKISFVQDTQHGNQKSLNNSQDDQDSTTHRFSKVPSSDFLQSLADIKIGQTSGRSDYIEEDQQSRLSRVNPALARLRQTFKTPDMPTFKTPDMPTFKTPEATPALQVQRLTQSLETSAAPFIQFQSSKSLVETVTLSNPNKDQEATIKLDIKVPKPEVSDSGIGTQGEVKTSSSATHKVSSDDKDPEPVSSASTLDGVVSLSAQPDEETQCETVRTHRVQLEKVIHHQSLAENSIERDSSSKSQSRKLLKHHSLEEMVLAGIRGERAKHAAVSRSMSQTEIEYSLENLQTFTPIQPYPTTSTTNQIVAPPTVIPISVPVMATQAWTGEVSEERRLSLVIVGEDINRPPTGAVPPIAIPDEDIGNTPSSNDGSSSARSSGSAVQRSQNLLLVAHEDQLSEITTLCKQEMHLLVAVRNGEKTFEEYIQDTEDLLCSKATAIETLRSQVSEFLQYPALRSNGNTPR